MGQLELAEVFNLKIYGKYDNTVQVPPTRHDVLFSERVVNVDVDNTYSVQGS